MSSALKKFNLLMWKHWLTTRRKYIRTVLEFAMPWLICILLTLLRGVSDYRYHKELHFAPFTVMEAAGPTACQPQPDADIFAYSPKSPFLKTVFTTLCSKATLMEFDDESSFNSQINSNDSLLSRLIMAVIFNDELKGLESSTALKVQEVQVNLRFRNIPVLRALPWQTDLLFPKITTAGPRHPETPLAVDPDYQESGFLFMQQMITTAFVSNGDFNKSLNLSINLQKFSHPEWSADRFYEMIPQMQMFISILLVVGWLLRYINNVQDLITEKEKQLKESMRAMGLPSWIMWCSWFTYSFIISLIVSAGISILCTVYIFSVPLYSLADTLIVFLFFLLAACCMTTFSFVISAIFSKATTGVTVGGFVFIFTMLPFIINSESQLLCGKVIIESLLVGSAICYGSVIIIIYEKTGDGMIWSYFWKPLAKNDASLGVVCVVLLFDTILYLLIALYIDAINPGQYGIPQPWYFIFTRRFWRGEPSQKVRSDDDKQESTTSSDTHEKYTGNAPVGVRIKNLCRTFGSNKVVNNLTLEMYEGQITALLGHNGAGKTTTMSMISGMLQPTSGNIEVYGHDVRTDFENIRGLLGLCPQHNILFDELTCYEHLYFICKLKGMPKKEAKEEIDKYLTMLNLQDKRKSRSKTLSGGMKRRLNIGMALCGNSKMVIFDEPTAGLDPSARRNIWDLLQSQREGRTMLLTTHFMDEADLLGDRIAIMTAGELQCVGTSFFLKKKFGVGYNIVMEVTPKCEPQQIVGFLRAHIGGARMQHHAGSELICLLPSKDSSAFGPLLRDLEARMSQLDIRSYGIAPISLEEIFLKVGADRETKELKVERKESKLGSLSAKWEINYESGIALLKNQIIAMFYKKIMYVRRAWAIFFFTHIVIPIFILCWIILSLPGQIVSAKALQINVNMYEQSTFILAGKKTSFYKLYEQMLQSQKYQTVANVERELISNELLGEIDFRAGYIVAASFEDSSVTAWFNSYPLHSAPLSLSLVLNVIFKYHFGDEYSITFTNDPLPLSKEQKYDMGNVDSFLFLSNALLYLSLPVTATYILFCIKERISESKHLQFVSGIKSYVFWTVAFICDYLTFFVAVAVSIITLYAIQLEYFDSLEAIGVVAVILIYFGFFAISVNYLLSLFFESPSGGVNAVLLIGILTGWLLCLMKDVFGAMGHEDISDMVVTICLFLPFASLVISIRSAGLILLNQQQCSIIGTPEEQCKMLPQCCDTLDFYAMDKRALGRNLIAAFAVGTLIILFLIIKEEIGFKLMRLCRISKKPKPKERIEEDVKEEEEKIRKLIKEKDSDESYILILQDMTKYFGKFLAVNGLCLGVKQFECFGLLGANGAGKTTSFKMMTGEESIHYGEVWIKGISVVKDLKKAQTIIGYCPQFDALLEELTPRETLKMFCLIRGINLKSCKRVSELLAKTLDFHKHLDKKVKQLSGGNKRKLSLAVAVIGDPVILFLDEPTTSMDPATKRFVWNTLAKLRETGTSIILTSHSMEECEALCTRLVVMVRGHFMCLGSTQRLKNKFAQGYSLTIKIKKTKNLQKDISEVKSFVSKYFRKAQLKEEFQELLTYQLTDSSMPCSQIFHLMESRKIDLNIDDYSLQQCSLEEVFLSFTRQQN